MTRQFEGKVALVTGGSSGIGRATAVAFASEGARVVVADVREDQGLETVDMIRRDGGEALFVKTDVSQPAEVRALIDKTVKTFGRLDYACNNAGIEGTLVPVADYPEESWNQVIAVNLTGVYLCMKYEIPEILKHGGAIVNMSSILGTVGFSGAPAYVAAKHGVIGLTKTAALDYSSQGIRINAVCPAFIVTPMLERAGLLDEQNPMYQTLVNLHPIRRLGTPEEIAEAVVWLCSDNASFITGHSLLVDGGYIAQ
ncbi:MAG: short chain dehydrogenase [Herpetosiphonaceae bacterium]|nr:MAG: short chain dehydrogenase [Herpetosiphonaceae bacterium]